MMFEKIKLFLVLAITVLLLVFIFPFGNFYSFILNMFYGSKDIKLAMSLVNPQVKTVSSDPSNRLVLKINAFTKDGKPVKDLTIDISPELSVGEVVPSRVITNEFGECLSNYIPPEYTLEQLKKNTPKITIKSKILRTNISSSIDVNLTNIPIILVHGYQETADIFANLLLYLSSNGYKASTISYEAEKGVVQGAQKLNDFLKDEKLNYLREGLQVNKFCLITHSMGGLVARYYTCSENYVLNQNINKILFVATPHKGTHVAAIGENYFSNQGVKDLVPDNVLLLKTLPSLINNGLNPNIEVGNILSQYDEVVTPESGGLEEWNIKTYVFNVGDNNINMKNLLNGNILDAVNHKNILSNKKVFDKIKEMLESPLPYPKKIR